MYTVIASVAGIKYGDGNLGTKGMALFFHSHECNEICHALGLEEFDLSVAEKEAIVQHHASSVSASSIIDSTEHRHSFCSIM